MPSDYLRFVESRCLDAYELLKKEKNFYVQAKQASDLGMQLANFIGFDTWDIYSRSWCELTSFAGYIAYYTGMSLDEKHVCIDGAILDKYYKKIFTQREFMNLRRELLKDTKELYVHLADDICSKVILALKQYKKIRENLLKNQCRMVMYLGFLDFSTLRLNLEKETGNREFVNYFRQWLEMSIQP